MPVYTKGTSPGADYVYIQEDWNWNPNTNTNMWDWNGNRWVMVSQQQQQVWVKGHWTKTSNGWMWEHGYWK